MERARPSISAAYTRHAKSIQHIIPPSNLLVWHVTNDGWVPVCRYLDQARVPSWPMPNDRNERQLRQMEAWFEKDDYYRQCRHADALLNVIKG